MPRWSALIGALSLAMILFPPPGGAQQASLRFRMHVVQFGSATGSAVAADFDGDGRLDVAAASEEEVAWFRRGPRPSFWRKHPVFRATAESGVVWSAWLLPYDLDRDGDPDLLSHTLANGNLAWYENPRDPEKAWTRRLIDNLPGVHCQVLEDLNRDGRPELVVNHEGAIVWYSLPTDPRAALAANHRGEAGTRQIWEKHHLARSGAEGQTHYLVFGDMDGDGDRDLCTGAAAGGYLAWWERPADATLLWSRHVVREELPGATHLAPADVNRDGKLDLVYSRGHRAGIGWLSGDGWRDERTIDADWLQGPHAMALADLDEDGDLDVAAAGRDNGRTAWWENDGTGRFTRHELNAAQAGNDIRPVDLDGDGDLDLLVAGDRSKNVVWFESLRR